MAKTESTRTPAIKAEVLIGDLTDERGHVLPSGLLLTSADGERLTVNVSALAPSIIAQAIVHGLKQKLVDAAAISRDPDTGREASVSVKWAAVVEVFSRITGANGQEPSWNKGRDGAASATGGLLYRALVRLYPTKTQDDIKGFLERKNDAEKAALRKTSKVAAIIEELRAEDAARKGESVADAEDLLGELDD